MTLTIDQPRTRGSDSRILYGRGYSGRADNEVFSGVTMINMAACVDRPVSTSNSSAAAECAAPPKESGSTALLDVVQASLHARPSEWIFLRELRVGTGFQRGSAQRLDAFALNCLAHTAMKRVCYEVKLSRADFLCEMNQPLKRRCGLRYSNEFYFVTPAELLHVSEVPIECGLIEIGTLRDERFAYFDATTGAYCRVTVPAPWRETPGPTWQFVQSDGSVDRIIAVRAATLLAPSCGQEG